VKVVRIVRGLERTEYGEDSYSSFLPGVAAVEAEYVRATALFFVEDQ
jgi:hypothetical protein